MFIGRLSEVRLEIVKGSVYFVCRVLFFFYD